MKIEQMREIDAPIDKIWTFFDDIPRVVSCMPGATLTEVVDHQTFEGTLGMKVGPISVNYMGTVSFDEKDPDSHSVQMTASGKDRKGAGSAQAKILATLTPSSPTSTTLSVSSDLRLTGRVASLGRGVQDVAGKVFEQFVRNVSDELTRSEQPAKEVGPPAPEDGASPTAPAGAALAGEANGSRPAGPPPSPRADEGRNDIMVLPLLWSILKDKAAALLSRLRRKPTMRKPRRTK